MGLLGSTVLNAPFAWPRVPPTSETLLGSVEGEYALHSVGPHHIHPLGLDPPMGSFQDESLNLEKRGDSGWVVDMQC